MHPISKKHLIILAALSAATCLAQPPTDPPEDRPPHNRMPHPPTTRPPGIQNPATPKPPPLAPPKQTARPAPQPVVAATPKSPVKTIEAAESPAPRLSGYIVFFGTVLLFFRRADTAE
ncbi:hypothetical protein [Pontiella sulfatireligans]|nr:hypothetical protein [Pontiella sulfatireligans]